MEKRDDRVDAYIAAFSEEKQAMMHQIRELIHEVVLDVEETISWKMPTFRYQGDVIHFAAFKNHIGLYPLPSGIEAFTEELSLYHTTKGAIQFPLGKDLPLDLIRKIILFRLEENKRLYAEKQMKAHSSK